jgi:signal transduction histidine kinase
VNSQADPQHSVQLIRRRLLALLMQAFGAVVVLTVVLLVVLLGALASMVTSGRTGYRPPLASELEAYYAGRGNWEGVERLADEQPGAEEWGMDWQNVALLDKDGRVVMPARHGSTGRVYEQHARDASFELRVDGQPVGHLIVMRTELGLLLRLFSGLAIPVGVISFFTGLLTLLIGLLLIRRFVTPLADVMAAAQAVAAGDLSARVEVRGPGDIRGLSDSFNRMAAALDAADRQRRSLLADVAHELRTPITVIRGRLEGIVDGVYPADEDHVAPVLEETYVLERLVEDLRTLTLAESRQLHFDPALIDLGDLAQRAVSLFEAEAAERNIELSAVVEPDLPPVRADAQRTGQVLGNLVSNALRYVPEHGQISIQVARTADGVEISVSDNGPGVPETDLPQIFDRFWRGERSRSRQAGGAGLGLAIARQLVEAQGGSIRAANRPDGGLRVAVVLKDA